MILRNPHRLRLFLRPGSTDMRKSFHTLAQVVVQEMKLNVLDESIFAFCSRNQKLVKILYWDGNGFCIWQKRLAKGIFPWPDANTDHIHFNRKEFLLLLSGVDFRKIHTSLKYSVVA